MFRATSIHTIDEKGRIIIPARFRDVIKANSSEGVMVSGKDKHLLAFTFEEWRKIEANILAQAKKDDSIRRFIRFFIGAAAGCNCDKQDRILIPPTLRDYAGLQHDIVLVGVLDHFEIWSKESYDQELQVYEDDLQNKEVRDKIAELGV